MEVYIPNEEHKRIVFLDCEYDGQDMRQLAAILFTKSEHGYELQGSLNRYINEPKEVNDFFINFTAITPHFLQQYGVPLEQVKKEFKDFVGNKDEVLIVAHNLKSDKSVLFKNGINLDSYDCYCTWRNAKNLMPNGTCVNVEHLAATQGWYLGSPHDAFYDAWALLPIFCLLKEKEGKE